MRFNDIEIKIFKDYDSMSKHCAHIVAGQLALKKNSVLGLATGATPTKTYEYLAGMYREGLVDFSEAITFNLDEYYPMSSSNPESYHFYMEENLFKHINIKRENIHMLDGETASPEKECADYDSKIRNSGGIDLQLLGIGVDGHIGFNEPADYFSEKTIFTMLNESTIRANAVYFKSEDDVPKHALSMGIKTIMSAEKVILFASGVKKAGIIKQALLGKITPHMPASVLKLHNNVTVLLDEEAASLLRV